MAKVIYPDGTVKTVALPAEKRDEFLRDLVGGWLEGIRLGDDWLMVNEEGKLQGLEPNMLATALIRSHGILDHIVGVAVLCSNKEID